MMLMGLAGPGQWRTSTLSTKAAQGRVQPCCFMDLNDAKKSWRSHGMLSMVQITGSCIVFALRQCSCLSYLRIEVLLIMLINRSGSAALNSLVKNVKGTKK